PSYGLPNPEMKEAIILTAREEGILLDPVYTGKSMAGVIGLIRKGFFQNNENVVFLHTGGTAALFAYGDELGKL
ncbi:MAG: aminocyclopropane-1-carboxylate deaminase/D-cysteine desulfhydrase family protein, partial [Rhodospirillales bacterium]|nr:aminocyclopropane-1-carboxylate deaminase/D-cysteine desulfhydrase family protein [Rhodospirillales bacterium]